MTQHDGYGGFSPTAYGAPAPYAPSPTQPTAPAPHMRPLSTGEVLDRTFALYRRHFWLFAGLGTLPAIMTTFISILRMVYLAVSHRSDVVQPGMPAQAAADAMATLLKMQVYLIPSMVLFLIAFGIAHAATVESVSRISRGVPVNAKEAYDHVRGRWLRWTGITLRQFWSLGWPMIPGIALIFGSIAIPAVRGNPVLVGMLFLTAMMLITGATVWGAINYIRNALAVPAALQEDLGVSASLRRSHALVAGRKGRIFMALLLAYALQMVAGGIQLPFVMLAGTTHGAEHIILQATYLLVAFVTITLITPVASIALCLFYVDERVRREGYDIELMMQRSFIPVDTSLQQQDPPIA